MHNHIQTHLLGALNILTHVFKGLVASIDTRLRALNRQREGIENNQGAPLYTTLHKTHNLVDASGTRVYDLLFPQEHEIQQNPRNADHFDESYG